MEQKWQVSIRSTVYMYNILRVSLSIAKIGQDRVYVIPMATGVAVSIDVDYTSPPDFNGGPNDYRAASSVSLTCQVSAGTSEWSSTCTGPGSNCFIYNGDGTNKRDQDISRTTLRSTDSGMHTCTATRGGNATIEMNVVGEYNHS